MMMIRETRPSSDMIPRPILRQSSIVYNRPSRLMSTKSSLPQRRVRFAVDGFNKINEDYLFYDIVSRELREQVFYSKRELHALLLKQQRLARGFAEANQGDLVTSVYCLYGYSYIVKADRSKSESHHPDGKNGNCYRDGDKDCEIELARRRLATSNCRGLEPLMTPLMSKRREWLVQKVLSLQCDLRRHGCMRREAAEAASQIAAVCTRSSRASIEYAHQLALGYQQEEEQAQLELLRQQNEHPNRHILSQPVTQKCLLLPTVSLDRRSFLSRGKSEMALAA